MSTGYLHRHSTQIVQSLFFLCPKFQASSHLLWLYSPVCVGPGLNTFTPRLKWFSLVSMPCQTTLSFPVRPFTCIPRSCNETILLSKKSTYGNVGNIIFQCNEAFTACTLSKHGMHVFPEIYICVLHVYKLLMVCSA